MQHNFNINFDIKICELRLENLYNLGGIKILKKR